MSSSLGGKSKEDEEYECTNDTGPLCQDISSRYAGVASPDDCRNLSDATKIVMRVFPADPWRGTVGYVQGDRENRHRSGEHDFRASQSHQAEVSAGREGRVS